MIKGLWSQLTPEQQKLALEYRGEENIMPRKFKFDLDMEVYYLDDDDNICSGIIHFQMKDANYSEVYLKKVPMVFYEEELFATKEEAENYLNMEDCLHWADDSLQHIETIRENIRVGLKTMHDLEEELSHYNFCTSNAIGYASK
jgi:hypothetical protein